MSGNVPLSQPGTLLKDAGQSVAKAAGYVLTGGVANAYYKNRHSTHPGENFAPGEATPAAFQMNTRPQEYNSATAEGIVGQTDSEMLGVTGTKRAGQARKILG